MYQKEIRNEKRDRINNILIDSGMSTKEKLKSLAKEGKIRLPKKKGKIPHFEAIKIKGKLLSEIIIDNRR